MVTVPERLQSMIPEGKALEACKLATIIAHAYAWVEYNSPTGEVSDKEILAFPRATVPNLPRMLAERNYRPTDHHYARAWDIIISDIMSDPRYRGAS